MPLKQKLLWVALSLGIAVVFAASLWKKIPHQQPLPILGQVSDFSFTDQEKRTVTLKDLQGKVWIADFIFTSCGGQCPGMSTRMAGLQERLPANVRLVSFSVDPETDSPAVLNQYSQRFGAKESWLFLTGPKKALQKMVDRDFRLALSEKGGTPEEPLMHSSRFVLLDKKSRIRGYYDSEEKSALKNLTRDARSLEQEPE